MPENETLYRQQRELSQILETSRSAGEASERLLRSSLAGSAWKPEEWAPAMLDAAISIARKWK